MFGETVTKTGQLTVTFEITNDAELILLSIEGSREKESPDHLSDVEAFEALWDENGGEWMFFPDGPPESPVRVKVKFHIEWIHTNTPNGEDWDSEVVIEEWVELPQPGCCVDGSCTENTCMRLPEGSQCGDCVYVSRCTTLFGKKETDTQCDWFPRRFLKGQKG